MGRVTGRAFSDALLVLAHWSGNSNLSVARGRGWVIDRTCGRMVEGVPPLLTSVVVEDAGHNVHFSPST